jgi:hypothetical protein
VTAERRLAAIEEALSPTEHIVRWLEEVHAYGSLEAAVRSMLDDPNGVPPLDRLVRAAKASALTMAKSKPIEERNKFVNQAVKETVFRFRLVMRIITWSQDLLDDQALIDAAFSAQLALRAFADPSEREAVRAPMSTVEFRDLVIGRVDHLMAAAEARTAVEQMYLSGHPAMFPDQQAEWAERLELSQRIGILALVLAEKEGAEPPTEPDTAASAAKVAQLSADLVEPARAEALEDVGEGRRAFGVASSWVPGKLIGSAA